jgi:hypothetical protein
MAELGFVMDDFARRHLREWYDAGLAPWGWTYETLLAFEDWLDANADDIYDDSSWSSLARFFDGSLHTD